MSQSVKILNEKLRGSITSRGIEAAGFDDKNGGILTDYLLSEGILESKQVNAILEESTGFPAIDPRLISYSQKFLDHISLLIPAEVLHDGTVFPIKHEGNSIHLVTADPYNLEIEKNLESWTGSRVKYYSCHTRAIEEALQQYFDFKQDAATDSSDEIIERAVKAINIIRNDQNMTENDLLNHSSVIGLLRMIVGDAVRKNSSDIHFEPQLDSFRIRIRLDGVLHTTYTLDKNVQEGIIPRIKMISGMRLDITKMPQDGRIDYHLVQGHDIDLRCSVLPTIYGEKAVLRILDKGANRVGFADFDLDPAKRTALNHAIHRPNGLVLVTGPTGSGKSTTLYAFLDDLNTEHVNISTAEDPVEYELGGIIQVPCDSETGVGFAGALRSLMRQDPDIIMVGEIRDLETADIAVKAALTGHLVFSTLHTNDAPGTITRIINLGISPLLLSSCGLTIVAQRLVRTICPRCKTTFIPDDQTLKALEMTKEQIQYYKGGGCENCSGTGYRGRASIMEVLVVNDEIERLILDQRPVGEIKQAAIRNGMTTLREDALQRLRQGKTTPSEVLRVTLDT